MTTETKFKSERDKMGFEECQKDPIFLLQRRRYIYHANNPKIRYDSDRETLVYTSNGKEITDKSLVEMEAASEVWETDRVFYSREEAEVWVKARDYNFRKGWRVYCVSAQGRLTEVLKAADAPLYTEERVEILLLEIGHYCHKCHNGESIFRGVDEWVHGLHGKRERCPASELRDQLARLKK